MSFPQKTKLTSAPSSVADTPFLLPTSGSDPTAGSVDTKRNRRRWTPVSAPEGNPSSAIGAIRVVKILFFLILALPASPALAGLQEPAVAELFSLAHCAGVSAGIRLVTAADLPGIHGGTLDPSRGAPDPNTTLLVISRGDQPTPGYGFGLADFQSDGQSPGTARLTLNWRTPPRDAILPQVITQPCIVVALPQDSLQRIEVFDQHGIAVGSVDLPH